ncbi:MAG: dihydrofolate reductase family protein [Gemmatimonadaceae bacterium]
MANPVRKTRTIVVNIATSADGYIARPDGDIEWLTRRPPPKGFYGMGKFMKSIDTQLLGRKTYDASLQIGATFDPKTPSYVFSHSPPASTPPGVEFIGEEIGSFAKRLREHKGKNIWLMGGGEIIASFLDEGAIDEFIVSVIPIFIGDGIPLIARRRRDVPLRLRSVRRFPDGVVQLYYGVLKAPE